MIRNAVLLNLILQIAGILGFITVSSLLAVAWLKMLVIALFAAGSAVVIFKFIPRYDLQRSIVLSLLSSLTFVIVYQAIGFGFYPGLVKDVSIFSSYHAYLSGVVFIILFFFYNFCCACLLVKKAKASGLDSDS
jgi:hypothetical protein